MVVGPILNRHARESNRLRAARAREHDDGVSRCGALVLRHTEREMRPKYTYRAEGLAATIRGRERGAEPQPEPPCPRDQPATRRFWAKSAINGVAVRHASELSVRSTHRAEGLAVTIRGRERGAGP